MKKVSILIAVLFAFMANTFAQTGAQTDMQAAPTTEKIGKHKGKAHKSAKNELNLTSEQKTRLQGIGSTNKGKIQAIKTDNALSKEQKRAKMVELKQAHDAEVKGVLNAEQYAKYGDLKKERREKMKEKRVKN
jgi:Spy/CpxP family protein refolding chaperone